MYSSFGHLEYLRECYSEFKIQDLTLNVLFGLAMIYLPLDNPGGNEDVVGSTDNFQCHVNFAVRRDGPHSAQ